MGVGNYIGEDMQLKVGIGCSAASDGALVITRDALNSRGGRGSRFPRAFSGPVSEATRRTLHVNVVRARPRMGCSFEVLVYPGCVCVLPFACMPVLVGG